MIDFNNESSKMKTAPILKSSTVSNYGDISQIFIFTFGHTKKKENGPSTQMY
jgi:hypothetical protein